MQHIHYQACEADPATYFNGIANQMKAKSSNSGFILWKLKCFLQIISLQICKDRTIPAGKTSYHVMHSCFLYDDVLDDCFFNNKYA